MSKTYYEILGVGRTASEREIKLAYHRLARKFHPDKAEEGADAAGMEAEFAVISKAYNVLKDREKRTAYDKSIELERQHELNRGGAAASGEPTKGPAKTPSAAAVEKGRSSVARRSFIKGTQFFAAGDYSRAAEFFEVAVKNGEDEAVYHAKLAQTLLRGHRSFSRATEAAQKAIALDPYNSEYRLILAEIYENADSMTMALRTYEEILKWDPNNEQAKQAIVNLRPKGSFLDRLFRRK